MRAGYAWTMRNGAQILFALSFELFLLGIGQALVAFRSTVGEATMAGDSIGKGMAAFLMLLTGTLVAFNSAVLPLLGAILINRWDEKHPSPSPTSER